MNYRFQITKIILIIIFWTLDDLVPIAGLFWVCGAILPWIDLVIAKEKYHDQFPWELYLFYGYVLVSLFIEVEPHLMYLGFGYALSRLILYFKLKNNQISKVQ